jgi:acetyl esterase
MKLFLYVSLVCLFLGLCMNTQGQETVRGECTYKTIRGMTLKAYLFYEPVADAEPLRPAIAFFHGGGWAYGNPSEFFEACKRYARKGFVTCSFQYRLSITEDGQVPHPEITPVESVKDARSAMRWLRKNAASYHVDPDRIIAAGQSAGGQLALCTALIDGVNEASDDLAVSPVPAALLLFSSNVNTMEAWADRLMGDRREEIWSISPYHNLKPGMPPAIEFHGTEDCMVPYWVVDLFREKSTGMNNHFELVTLEGRPHYLAEGNEKYATYFDEEILERTDTFLVKFGFMDPAGR